MINLFRFSQVRTLQGEGFKLIDALRLAYRDIYYIQYRKNNNLLTDFIKGSILSIPFVLVFFV
jgi:hypothetical protein